jgi:hypothetical protein
MQERQAMLGLLRPCRCWLPTVRGWLVVLFLCAATGIIAVLQAHAFLAMNRPIRDGILVVEGWVPDYAFEETWHEFKRGAYAKLYVTGGPIDKGQPLLAYKTYAELGAATLFAMGASENSVVAVPAATILKDRTYVSALALRTFLRDRQLVPTSVTVVSIGAHSRRTRFLFQKALGDDARVGVIAVRDQNYDPQRWWASSMGFRAVTDEWIAYAYARTFFRPRNENPAGETKP